METNPVSIINNYYEKNKYLLKGIIIAFLIFALFIPTLFIHSLVAERNGLHEQVKAEVSNSWSGAQEITGPVLVIPYLDQVPDSEGKMITQKKLSYFLPEQLNISGTVASEIRYRSIHKIAVYNADLVISGKFNGLPLQDLGIREEQLLMNEAQVIVGLSDFRGINEQLVMKWEDGTHDMNATITENEVIAKGLGTTVPMDSLSAGKRFAFSLPLKIKGSERISFVPVGKTTSVSISSPWQNPGFSGNFLPSERTVDDNGFQASWKILHLNREFPQQWTDRSQPFSSSAFGVDLLQPVDAYTQTTRTIKYALLVILLTFAIYFFVEVFQKKSVHPIQYALVGSALCIFYLLLLSIAEYLPFLAAYLIAAAATILLISLYTSSVFRSLRTGAIFGGFLTLLYLFIYTLIRMQDGALLIGSIGLFVILSGIMYFSRKIDWITVPQAQKQL